MKQEEYISRKKYYKLYGIGKTITDMRVANGVLKEKNGKVKWVRYNT